MTSSQMVTRSGMTITAPMELVPLADGILAPRRLSLRVDRPSYPFVATLDVGVIDGKIVCEEVTFRQRLAGASITTASLRRQPLERWAREAVMATLLGGAVNGDHVRAEPLARDVPDDDPALGRADVRPRNSLNRAKLRDVAKVYRSALEKGLNPVATVAAVHHVPRNTAKRWVRAARAVEVGGLGPTTPGRKGEHGVGS